MIQTIHSRLTDTSPIGGHREGLIHFLVEVIPVVKKVKCALRCWGVWTWFGCLGRHTSVLTAPVDWLSQWWSFCFFGTRECAPTVLGMLMLGTWKVTLKQLFSLEYMGHAITGLIHGDPILQPRRMHKQSYFCHIYVHINCKKFIYGHLRVLTIFYKYQDHIVNCNYFGPVNHDEVFILSNV